MIASRHFGLECLLSIGVQPRDTPVSLLQLREQLRQFPVARRPAYQAPPRRSLEDALAFLLRHASEHTDDFALVLLLPEFPEPRKYFLRCFFPDAARVIEND